MPAMGLHNQLLLVDEPYVSDYLRKTIAENSLPVVLTEAARSLGFDFAPYIIDEAEAIERARASSSLSIYTVSENSIEWISRNLAFHHLPSLVQDFKNKARFRSLIRPMYPSFFFEEIALEDLTHLDIGRLPMPFVIKPSVGFFSLGVHRVSNPEQWIGTRKAIHASIRSAEGLFPKEVMDPGSWLIEECIDGEESAVDAYFDDEGKAVILGIWRHAFASEDDTGDRVYSTSRSIIESDRLEIALCLDRIGAITNARNLPVHAELRRLGNGFVPIEINPLRFGGWCTTADLTQRAFGFNPYLAFFHRQEPDWPKILKDKGNEVHSIIVLDNKTGIDQRRITEFDYNRLLTRFSNPLELRKVDFSRYPLFGFVFVETPGLDRSELDWILGSDLREFVTIRA